MDVTEEDILKEEDKKRTVSFSQYSTYLNCPWEWKLKYIDKLKSPSNIYSVFGTAMHNTLQTWITLLYTDEKKVKIFDIKEELKQQLINLAKEELRDEEGNLTVNQKQFAEIYADGCNIIDHVKKYKKDWFVSNRKLIGVEVPIEILLPNNTIFRGYYDVVLYHKATKTYYIYDFKTSTRGWFPSDKKKFGKIDQLLLYKKYFADQHNIPVDNIIVEFIILRRKTKYHPLFPLKHVSGFSPPSGKRNLQNAMDRFNNFLSGGYDNNGNRLPEQIATPSEYACRFCMFRNDKKLCPSSWYNDD